jgi:hypothetical protein
MVNVTCDGRDRSRDDPACVSNKCARFVVDDVVEDADLQILRHMIGKGMQGYEDAPGKVFIDPETGTCVYMYANECMNIGK